AEVVIGGRVDGEAVAGGAGEAAAGGVELVAAGLVDREVAEGGGAEIGRVSCREGVGRRGGAVDRDGDVAGAVGQVAVLVVAGGRRRPAACGAWSGVVWFSVEAEVVIGGRVDGEAVAGGAGEAAAGGVELVAAGLVDREVAEGGGA